MTNTVDISPLLKSFEEGHPQLIQSESSAAREVTFKLRGTKLQFYYSLSSEFQSLAISSGPITVDATIHASMLTVEDALAMDRLMVTLIEQRDEMNGDRVNRKIREIFGSA